MTLEDLKHDSLPSADGLIPTTDGWNNARAAIRNLPWRSPMPSNLELMNVSDDCWTPDTSFANVIEVAIKR